MIDAWNYTLAGKFVSFAYDRPRLVVQPYTIDLCDWCSGPLAVLSDGNPHHCQTGDPIRCTVCGQLGFADIHGVCWDWGE